MWNLTITFLSFFFSFKEMLYTKSQYFAYYPIYKKSTIKRRKYNGRKCANTEWRLENCFYFCGSKCLIIGWTCYTFIWYFNECFICLNTKSGAKSCCSIHTLVIIYFSCHFNNEMSFTHSIESNKSDKFLVPQWIDDSFFIRFPRFSAYFSHNTCIHILPDLQFPIFWKCVHALRCDRMLFLISSIFFVDFIKPNSFFFRMFSWILMFSFFLNYKFSLAFEQLNLKIKKNLLKFSMFGVPDKFIP